MIFTIEPMINAGRREIRELADGWTIVTKDHSLSAQWEHTVLVTETGFEVLTVSPGMPAMPAAWIPGRPPERRRHRARFCQVSAAATLRRRAGASFDGHAVNAPDPQAAVAARLRQELSAGRRALFDAFADHHNTGRLLQRHRQLVDRVLSALWEAAGLAKGATLVAVGGYGRGDLYPFSDVDVLLLSADAEDDDTRARLESLVSQFWDVGIEAGHSVRTIDECLIEAAGDITIQTNLIEARYVAGDRALFRDLQIGVAGAVNPQDFYIAKKLELEQRHNKYQDTPYSLEPNCKESPGGLRDLQVILWIARAARLGQSWRELAARHIITRQEAAMLAKREGFCATCARACI